MPANLTPDYERAEQRYRAAATDDERLTALRDMFAHIPKHKGTEKLQADIKRKISQLRKLVAKRPARGTDLYHVPHAGAGQVVLVGPPNSGKSSLVARTTHAPVKVADYPFTTALPVPGMAHWQDVQIELVDTPPVTAEHVPGGLLGTIRNADIIAIVVDASNDPLEQADATIDLLTSRGLLLRSVPRDQIDHANPAEHCAVLVLSKTDAAEADTVATFSELYAGRFEVFPISATTGAGIDQLIHRFWQLLSLIRVYTKQPHKPPDNTKPFTLEHGSTVEDLARLIHQELPAKMKFARIWGDGRFAGQQVHRTELLHDRDVVEIHE
jgi:ribosome-interacting GTPase 1